MTDHRSVNDAETIIREFESAHNAQDVERALACYAAGATRDVRPRSMKEGAPFEGKDEIRRWLEGDAEMNARVEIGALSEESGRVSATARVWADKFEALGVEPMVADETFVVEDGKITRHESAFTEESVKKLREAAAART